MNLDIKLFNITNNIILPGGNACTAIEKNMLKYKKYMWISFPEMLK